MWTALRQDVKCVVQCAYNWDATNADVVVWGQLFPEPAASCAGMTQSFAGRTSVQKNGRWPPGGISVSRIVSSSGFIYKYYTGMVRSVHVTLCQFMSYHVNVSVSRHKHTYNHVDDRPEHVRSISIICTDNFYVCASFACRTYESRREMTRTSESFFFHI